MAARVAIGAGGFGARWKTAGDARLARQQAYRYFAQYHSRWSGVIDLPYSRFNHCDPREWQRPT